MGFLVPGFLAGLAFAGIPFLLHLIFRRRAPEVVFAATRFLRVATRRTARRRRLENLLLLILRTLLVALLAMGLAGPIITRATPAGRSGSDVVIVIDNSASMEAAEDGQPRFTKAKRALDDVLGRLESGDMAALVPTCSVDGGAHGGLSAERSGIRQQAARLQPAAARGSLAAALESAARLLEPSTAANRLVYLITDLQASSFGGADALSDEARSVLLRVPIVVYDCGGARLRNISLVGLTILPRGGTVGSPVEIRAEVSSNSPIAETVRVTLIANGTPQRQRALTLAPGSSDEVVFQAIGEAAGAYTGFVEIETDDALSTDDRRYFATVFTNRIKTLLLAREKGEPAFDDDLFFLRRALDPFLSGPESPRAPFDVDSMTYGEAGPLGAYDLVFLMLRGGIDAGLLERLSSYAAGGGSLVAFACPDADKRAVPGALPARLVATKSADRAAGGSFTFSSLDVQTPALAAFADEPPALYNNERVYDYWMCEPLEGAAVLARLDTGDAAVIEGAWGAGRTVLFALAPLRTSTTLVSSKFFLPLIHEISFHLMANARGLGDVYAGDTVRLAAPERAQGGLVVTNPGGDSRLVEVEAGRPLLFTDTRSPGPYLVRKPDEMSDSAAFTVNLDPAETDLARLEADDLPAHLPGAKVLVADSPSSLSRALASIEPVLALGDVILYAVLALALVECLAANRLPYKSSGEK